MFSKLDKWLVDWRVALQFSTRGGGGSVSPNFPSKERDPGVFPPSMFLPAGRVLSVDQYSTGSLTKF
jgi:hypothetical protein